MTHYDTIYGEPFDGETLHKYLSVLVNRFFKILPIREQESESFVVYVKSLLSELLGCRGLVCILDNDPDFATLLFILQYMIEHDDISISEVRREVFRSTSICNKLKARYCSASAKAVFDHE